MQLMIGGDTFPGYFEAQFVRGEMKAILGDLLDELQAADLTVVNLECPLTDGGQPIRKQGPHFKAHPDVVNGLLAAGIDGVTLANNHIRDYGEIGIEHTIVALKEAGIRSFGAGKGIDEAGKVAVFEHNAVRVGLLGMAEHEFSIAGNDSWGANPIDLMRHVELMDELRNAEEPLDHLVILLHAGNEYYHYPSPWLQRLCRFLVDQGATAVICQHSHVAGTYEVYNGSLIVYGQGNFVFGRRGGLYGQEGFLVKLLLENNQNPLQYELIPFTQSADGLRRMTSSEKSEFIQAIGARNRVLGSPQLLRERWHEFALSRKHAILSRFAGQPRVLRSMIHRLGLANWWYRRYDVGPVLNYVQCESHREAVVSLLEIMFEQGSTQR